MTVHARFGEWTKACLALACLFAASSLCAYSASDRYRSPRNPERSIRKSTELIVLHTTEAAARGSLLKLQERGECHFCVTEEGIIYRIVDRDREAFHAGRSIWNGKEDVDKFSIGIECVGHHDVPMPMMQLVAIRDLVKELQKMYHLSDEKVVTHSMVAYGAPNKWQKHKHRGRKRCGMLFAMPSVRAVLNLKARMKSDPDVKAKRVVVGDKELERILYGGVDTMRSAYPSAVAGNNKPTTTRSVAAGNNKPTTTSHPPPKSSNNTIQSTNRRIDKSTNPPDSVAELRSRGYVIKGIISKTSTASSIAGKAWNSPDTYYTIRNKVFSGDKIDPKHIELEMCVWMKSK